MPAHTVDLFEFILTTDPTVDCVHAAPATSYFREAIHDEGVVYAANERH